MSPTLRQLEYVVAVAEHLHFRRAAEACHVSQPALSNQIAQVEETLGLRIFERGTSRVLVTPEGQELVAAARRVLEEASALGHLARHLRQPFTGRLRLGTIPTMAPYLLPDLVASFRRHHPELELVVDEEQTASLLTRLRRGELDLLFLALPIADEGFELEPLFDEEFVLALPEEHRLAGEGEVPPTALSDEDVLLLDDGHCFRDHALEVCQWAGARERSDVRAAHLGTLVELVRARMGITLLPRSSLAVLSRDPAGLCFRAFADPVPTRRLGLAWRRGSGHPSEYRQLGRSLREDLSTVEGLRPVEVGEEE